MHDEPRIEFDLLRIREVVWIRCALKVSAEKRNISTSSATIARVDAGVGRSTGLGDPGGAIGR